MKIAVFGCSHSGGGPCHPKETWPWYLSEMQPDIIHWHNYAIGGTSTQWQYDQFQKVYDRFDQFIFQFTTPYRLTQGSINDAKKLKENYICHPTNNKPTWKFKGKPMPLMKHNAGRASQEWIDWISSGKNEILKEYREICETVINDKKALYCFYFAPNEANLPNVDVISENYLKIKPTKHYTAVQNHGLAHFLKSKTQLGTKLYANR